MCLSTTNGRISHSIVLPNQLRPEVLTIAHNHSGHFGVGTTRALINPYFTWTGYIVMLKIMLSLVCNAKGSTLLLLLKPH